MTNEPATSEPGPLGPPTNGAPPWAFLEMPKPAEGETIPPIPVTFAVGLTAPNADASGHQWAILRGTDGTVTVDFRIPWQFAAQVGMSIAQGLAAMAGQAEAAANSGLIVPPGARSGLVIAPSGAVPEHG